MVKSRFENEILALWLTPLAATIPLIPIFSIRSSPLFLGGLMNDPTHPMTWPWLGPLLSAMGVVFDGTILGFAGMLFAAPAWLALRERGKLSSLRVALSFALIGIAVSQFVHLMAHFRQPGLLAFASSWLSPVLGALCGITAGVSAVYLAKRSYTVQIRSGMYALPITVILVCGATMVCAAGVWRGR